MSRKLPERKPPQLVLQPTNTITEIREYTLITPLFGGGVEPSKADPITVVRASEIRGQLRFWWRATRGGQFKSNLVAMRAAEEAIWGGPGREENGREVGGQSRVQVVVREWKNGTAVQASKEVPKYAAFPLQSTSGSNTSLQSLQQDVEFTLEIRFDKQYQADVAAALWAWETFGGLGARTRRGFGALRLKSVKQDHAKVEPQLPPADQQEFAHWLTQQLANHIPAEDWPQHVPHLVKQLRYRVITDSDPIQIWDQLIDKLQQFRQHRQPGKYGHSSWPEPNAIRHYNGRQLRGPYKNRLILQFPRAQFGLPIIFHMPHDSGLDSTLEGEDCNRLASPLILKPVACRDSKAIGLAIILEGTTLPQLVLKQNKRLIKVSPSLTQKEASQIPPLHGTPNVLEAFLDTL
ncbi:MAG: type III-B CRISPR module RAMP protein Cmr1 [Chloroflexus sp.]